MFCLKCGAKLIDKLMDGNVRQACPSCNFVHWKNPTPIAGVILEHNEKVLLVQRRIDPPDRYALIAGFIEEFESAEGAALREVKEEVGLDAAVMGIVGTYSCQAIALNAVFIVMHCCAVSDQLKLGEELTDMKHFPHDALPHYPSHFPISQAFRDWRATGSDMC